MTNPRPILIALVILAASLLAGLFCLALALVSDPARRAFDEVMVIIPAVLYAGVVLVCGGVLALIIRLVGTAVTDVAGHWHRRFVILPDESGAYPLVPAHYQVWNPTPESAQMLAAWGDSLARHNVKPTAAATRALALAARQPQLPAPTDWAPPVPLSSSPIPVIAPDEVRPAAWTGDEISLSQRPHFGFFGATGSGKSTAIFALVARLMHMDSRAEFLVLEPGGVTWGDMCAAWTDEGMATGIRAVEAEMMRREGLLKAANVQDADTLPPGQRLRRLIIIVEEAESAIDALRRLTRRNDAERTVIALRNLARRGRKVWIHLVTATQFGRSDSFDTSVRNNLNLYIMRGAPGMAEMLRVSRQVDVTTLPVGVAYSTYHRSLVQFPRVSRPQLPISGLFREGKDGWSSGEFDITGEAVVESPTTVVQPPQPTQPVVVGPAQLQPLRLQPGRAPTPAQAAMMRQLLSNGWSKTAICYTVWGYKDGVVWEHLEKALAKRSM